MLGFTQKEQGVLLFLAFGLLAGLGVQWIRQHGNPVTTAPIRTIAEPAASDTMAVQLDGLSAPDAARTAAGISINRAGFEGLQRIPGVGPVLARRIVEYREAVGRFHRLDDLLAIRGIGPKMLRKMTPYITCE